MPREWWRLDVGSRAPKLERVFYLVGLVLAGTVIALPIIGLLLPLLSVPQDVLREISLTGRHWWLLGRSLVFSGLAAAIAMAFGTTIAVLLMGSGAGRAVLIFVLAPMAAVPPSIHGFSWATAILLAEDWLRRVIGMVQSPGGWGAAITVQVLSMFPLAAAIAWAGFAVLETRMLEAGLVFRSTPAVIGRIMMPLVGPVLGAGTGVLFLLSLSDYSVPSLFSINLYALEIFSAYSSGAHPAVALVTAAPIVGVIILVLGFGLRIGRKAEAMALSRRGGVPASKGIWIPTGLTWIAAAILLIQFLIPLVIMAANAGSWKFVTAASLSARSEIGMSLVVSIATSILCLILGLATGYALGIRGGGGAAWWILTIAAFALPGPLIGIGLIKIAGSFPLWTEEILPVWASLVRFFPIAAFVFYALNRRNHQGLIEAAQVFGRSRLSILRRVSLPLILPGVVVAGVVCFSMTMGELGATLLVAPPGKATLVMRLYNLLHYGASRDVAALCLLLSLCALAASGAMTIILNRSGHRIIERHPDA